MSLLQNSNAISAGGGYTVDNSLRFRSSASAYLSRTPASSGTRTTWTWSGWVKRGALGASHAIISCGAYSTNLFQVFFDDSTNTLRIQNFPNSTTPDVNIHTSQVFRDPSAWYHIVVVMDTTQATSSNRVKMYVNGSQVTAFSTATYPAQNATPNWNTGSLQHNIGARDASTLLYDGYLAETYFIDGSAKTPSDFGETDTTTGVWKPKAYTGTYGTNGFYLKFSDIATTSGSNAGLGKDFSGNTNYWTTNNISVTSGTTYDAMIDSPTNATSGTRPVGNYCVLNPLDKNATGVALSSANLKNTTSSLNVGVRGTMAVSSGKWYWETTITTATNTPQVGIATKDWGLTYVGSSNGVGYLSNATKYINGTGTSYGATFTTGDVIGVALDMDGGTITFYKNNVSQGSAATGLSGEYFPAVAGQSSDVTDTNFGQRPFAYTPPTGYQALCTTNLPTPTILQGNQYMDATLYTGTGSTQSITNAGAFKPDLVWWKSRSGTGNHGWTDSIRGVTKQLSSSDITVAEQTTSDGITAFNANGWSIGSGATGYSINGSTVTYVGWQWQAGQGSTSTNTAGSITSTVSVNTTAGFSVVTYTANSNSTVGHGLGVAPKVVIMKSRTVNNGWLFGSDVIGWTNFLWLNLTNASTANSTVWNNTAPTSSVFTLGSGVSTANYGDMVAYCWAEIAGFSKIGSYTGNGSTDGPFVYTGFRPKFMMMKRTDSTGDWYMVDSSRATYNQIGPGLNPNTSSAEFTLGSPTGGALDFLSNGFKWRGTYIDMNANGGTYIFMAFAENPFGVNCRAR